MIPIILITLILPIMMAARIRVPELFRGLRALLPLALASLAAIAGCAHRGGPAPIQPTELPGGGALLRIEQAGTSQVALERDPNASPWETLSMRNAGATPLRRLDFWNQGRSSLILPPAGNFKPGDLYTSFNLLPGEDFALSAPAGTEQLIGLMQWLSPRDPKVLEGSFQKMQNAKINPDGSITLTPGDSEAWVQFALTAPLTYSSVRIAWEAEPEPAAPHVEINLDGKVWAGISLPRPRVDWLHPADLTQAIAGNRRFWLRLVYEAPKEGRAPDSLNLRRIRIDRELQGPGHLREWRKGVNRFALAVQGSPKPELEIRLNGKSKPTQ